MEDNKLDFLIIYIEGDLSFEELLKLLNGYV